MNKAAYNIIIAGLVILCVANYFLIRFQDDLIELSSSNNDRMMELVEEQATIIKKQQLIIDGWEILRVK